MKTDSNNNFRIFAFADPHLSFGQEKPMDVFNNDWKNHHIKILDACLENVRNEDYIIIAGDISWALKFDEAIVDLDWIDSLPGKKILVKGNHDLWWHSITRLNTLYENIHFLQNDHFMIGELAICGSRGWLLPGDDGYTEDDEKINRRELIRLKMSLDSGISAGAKEIICAMHYPPANNPNTNSEFTKLISNYPVSQVVYGHLHGSNSFKKGIKGKQDDVLYRLVSVDYIDFKPVLIFDSSAEID